MMWAYPAALWLGIVAIPVAMLFLYRRRSRVLEVPAVEIWAQIGRPVSVHSLSTLLRRLVALALQLLLVALLVMAIADPSPHAPPPARTIIVLDVSATMQTREGGRTRMELAVDAARRALSRMGPDSGAVVLQAGVAPIVAAGPNSSAEAARRAVDRTTALDVEGDLERTVRAAAGFVEPARRTDVVVISDFAAADPSALRGTWHSTANLRLVGVGESYPDAAIVGLWSGQDESGARRVVASIAQRGMLGREVPVTLHVDGRVVATQRVKLEREPVRVSLSSAMRAGATFEVRVEANDALSVDDRAFGVSPRLAPATSICLVTAGSNPALQRALSADPSVRLRVVRPADFVPSAGDAVVIVDGPGLIDRDPGEVRGYLFINTADPFGWSRTRGGPVAAPPVSHWADNHPTMADIDPTLFRVTRTIDLDWTQGSLPAELVGADRWPVIEELARRTRAGRTVRCLYWMFDLADTDLPRRASFPLLLWNAVEYLASGGGDPHMSNRPDWQRTGRPLELADVGNDPGAPRGAVAAPAPVVLDPANEAVEVRPVAVGWVVPGAGRQGIYRRKDPPEALLAANLLSARGTMLIHAVPRSPDADVPDASEQQAAGSPLLATLHKVGAWRALLAAGALIALVEWALYNRRVVRIG